MGRGSQTGIVEAADEAGFAGVAIAEGLEHVVGGLGVGGAFAQFDEIGEEPHGVVIGLRFTFLDKGFGALPGGIGIFGEFSEACFAGLGGEAFLTGSSVRLRPFLAPFAFRGGFFPAISPFPCRSRATRDGWYRLTRLVCAPREAELSLQFSPQDVRFALGDSTQDRVFLARIERNQPVGELLRSGRSLRFGRTIRCRRLQQV